MRIISKPNSTTTAVLITNKIEALTLQLYQTLADLTHFSQARHGIETNHLISVANQMTGFHIKYNAWLKWVNQQKF